MTENRTADKPGALVETSIQFVRLLYQTERRAKTERLCADFDLFTSQTVYREFFVGLARAAKFVTSALLERPNAAAPVGIADIMRSTNEFRGTPRELKKINFVVALLVEISNEDKTCEDLAIYLEGEMRRMRDHGFFVFGTSYDTRVDVRDSGQYLESLACSVAGELVEAGRSTPSCNGQTRTCLVRSQLGSRREALISVAEQLRDSRAREQERLREIASKPNDWFSQGDRAIGQRLCWPIGDTLIALECPQGVFVLTTDRDFEAVSPNLGCEVLRVEL